MLLVLLALAQVIFVRRSIKFVRRIISRLFRYHSLSRQQAFFRAFHVVEVHAVLHLHEGDTLVVGLHISLIRLLARRSLLLIALSDELLHVHLAVAADIEDIV